MESEPLPIVGYVRQVRRRTKTSQRELARYLKVPHSTISRIESGARTPTIATLAKILRFAGLSLTVVDHEGRFCPPLEELADTRDWASRRWPAHLGLILDPRPGEWWGDQYGLVRPPETVHRDPAARRRHREVFHTLRGIATVSDVRDWRERRAADSKRLAKEDARRLTCLGGRAAVERARRRDPGRAPPGPA
jgi:transcriptional regulator with XRE-family HTH domain